MSAVLAPVAATLRVVTRTGDPTRLLDQLETHALMRTFGDGAVATRAEEEEAHRVIRRLDAKREQLGCQCRADGTLAVMRPYLTPDGLGALRSPGGGHSQGCPFRVATTPRGHLRIEQRASSPRRSPPPMPSGLRRPLANNIGPVATL